MYARGHTVEVVDQDSHPVTSGVLTGGQVNAGACLLRATYVVPAVDKSLWLPADELGIAGCRSKKRGGVLYDRGEPDVTLLGKSVNVTLGLPSVRPTDAPRPDRPC
jgi:hypothetical protein